MPGIIHSGGIIMSGGIIRPGGIIHSGGLVLADETQAQKDGAAYKAKLASLGKTITAPAYAEMLAYATGEYALYGRCDFVSMRPEHNVGSGSIVVTWLCVELTLVNGPTWDTTGILLNGTNQHITSTILSPAGVSGLAVCGTIQDAAFLYNALIGYQDSGIAILRLSTTANYGVGVPGVADAAAVIPWANNTIGFFVGVGAKEAGVTAIKSAKDGSAFGSANVSSRPAPSTNPLNFGRHNLGGFSYQKGLIHFGSWALPSFVDSPALYSLYKSTIGQGLGLP